MKLGVGAFNLVSGVPLPLSTVSRPRLISPVHPCHTRGLCWATVPGPVPALRPSDEAGTLPAWGLTTGVGVRMGASIRSRVSSVNSQFKFEIQHGGSIYSIGN